MSLPRVLLLALLAALLCLSGAAAGSARTRLGALQRQRLQASHEPAASPAAPAAAPALAAPAPAAAPAQADAAAALASLPIVASAPAPAASGALEGEGASCSFNGQRGTCTAGACATAKITGLCPGHSTVRCCIPPAGKASSAPKASSKPASAASSSATGQKCSYKGTAGTCTTGACNGTKFSGLCPGSAANQCCVPKAAKPAAAAPAAAAPAASAAPASAASSGPKSLAGAFPYSFPYSTKRHIVGDIAKQLIRLYDGSTLVKEWKMSSGINGVSHTPNSHGSPIGRMRIGRKIGAGAPLNTIFEGLKSTGRLGAPTDAKAYVQTRVLTLTGLDKENANTASRAIYIHGTNAEMQLGWQGSHGCFRMGNADVVELFDLVSEGTEVYMAPKDAWP